MKHLKNLNDWLAESRVQRLIALGLAEPDDFFRIDYEISTGYLTRSWERFQKGYMTLPAYYGGSEQDRPAFPPAQWWAVPKSYKSEDFAGSRHDVTWPDGLSTEALRLQALSLDLVEFLDWVDSQVMDHIVQTRRTPADWTQGTIVVRSVRTGKMEEVVDSVQESSGAGRLMALGLLDPDQVDRIEYNCNRYALENAHESLRYKGYVPSHKLDAPFFFIYGGRADGASTGRPAGTRFKGSDFLTRDTFTGMEELSGDEFLAKITELFIDWLKTQPDEFFTKEIGLTGRPLLIRDETDALMGMRDWTPLSESKEDGFSKLLSLGLIDPASEPRVEYGTSTWFINFMVDNAALDKPTAGLWQTIKKEIVSRIMIYNGGEQVSRWVSIMAYDIFDGLKDFQQICSMNLDAAALKALIDERIVKKIKQGFSTNWSTSPDPNPDPADERLPTLIKRREDTQWKPFSLNESARDSNLMRLVGLGLAQRPVYIAYEINGHAIDDLIRELQVPEQDRGAKWHRDLNSVLRGPIAWWEHRRPLPEGESLYRDYATVDDYSLLDEGGLRLGRILMEDEALDASHDAQELWWELSERVRKYIIALDQRLFKPYPPAWITEVGTDEWYSMETADRINESANLDNHLRLMKLGLADPPAYLEYRVSILPELWQALSTPEDARTREQSNSLVRLYVSSDIVQWRETHNGKHWAKGRLSLKDLLGPDHEVEIGDTEEDFRQWVEIRAFEALSELAPKLDVPAEMIREFGTDDWYSIDGSYLGNIDIPKRP